MPATGDPVLVVRLLERPAALASPAADMGIEVLGWAETGDPFAMVADRLRAALGRPVGPVALANRMWFEHAVRLQAVLGGGRANLAGAVMRDLRIRKSLAEVEALRRAGRAIDRVHERMGEWL